jgi:hypothetical protein
MADMTAHLRFPWWLIAQGIVLAGLVVTGALRQYRAGMAIAVVGFALTFVSHDFRGRHRS